ncbi:MAG TPA: pyridoxamine 5'-phosphate oxidase family protein [Stellaceae bacterium]|nr:pyridoxamine 5'-phosphate oxidase family protein [Stellaceae bacterium]
MSENAAPSATEVAAGADGSPDSPFHAGELALQERVGVRAKLDAWGRKGIRPFMPDQHRQFFAQLPCFFVGSTDRHGRPWASILAGAPGFITSPDAKSLHVSARAMPGDPLAAALRDGAALGGLGIELHTRRRNRVNGKATLDPDGSGFVLSVDQSFGNCAQYIQARATTLTRSSPPNVAPAHRGTTFDDAMRRILASADTFFIASRHDGHPADPRNGVDVSHRGGRPGFVDLLDDRTLQWPDYRGNFFFNTLGNIALDPRCGLLFIDFERGGTLQLTGRGEILWEWDRSRTALRDAQRVVCFHLEEAVHIAQGLPFEWEFLGQAPQLADHGKGAPST